jgi:hypothetical protein
VPTDEEIDRLYGLPLDEFTPARNELAKRLRSEGQSEEATRVRGLPKPTAAAWAVNQLARSRPSETRSLLDAGERLRKVHERLASGKADADELRSAAADEREAVQSLMQAARGLLGGRGGFLSEPVLDRVESTLHAAAADDEAREGIESGRLARERTAVALGAPGAPLPAGKPRKAARAEKKPAAKETKPPAPSPDRELEVRERAAQRKQRLGELRRVTRRAEDELEKLQKRQERAAQRREEAERAAAEARGQEKDARARAREIERELKKARAELNKLEE